MAMFSFFIYDLFQALYDSNFHSPLGQSKSKTFIWYFLVQIVWSLLFAIFCHLTAVTLVNLGVYGGDILAYLFLIALLSIRNLCAGGWYVLNNSRPVDQKLFDFFKTSATARMGIYLGSTLIFAVFFVLSGAGLSYFLAWAGEKL
jgi:hypothetical protein